jgi:hypothetical protein
MEEEAKKKGSVKEKKTQDDWKKEKRSRNNEKNHGKNKW